MSGNERIVFNSSLLNHEALSELMKIISSAVGDLDEHSKLKVGSKTSKSGFVSVFLRSPFRFGTGGSQ